MRGRGTRTASTAAARTSSGRTGSWIRFVGITPAFRKWHYEICASTCRFRNYHRPRDFDSVRKCSEYPKSARCPPIGGPAVVAERRSVHPVEQFVHEVLLAKHCEGGARDRRNVCNHGCGFGDDLFRRLRVVIPHTLMTLECFSLVPKLRLGMPLGAKLRFAGGGVLRAGFVCGQRADTPPTRNRVSPAMAFPNSLGTRIERGSVNDSVR